MSKIKVLMLILLVSSLLLSCDDSSSDSDSSSNNGGNTTSDTGNNNDTGNNSGGADSGNETSNDDKILPYVVEHTPQLNAKNVTIKTSISISFSEDIDETTVSTLTLKVNDGEKNISGKVEYSNKVATFTPFQELAFDTEYSVTLTTSITDMSGNCMESDYNWSFHTDNEPDIIAPFIVSKTPVDDNVKIDTKIQVTFSEEILKSSLNSSTFKVSTDKENAFGTITYFNKVATFTFNQLYKIDYGTRFYVTLTDGIKDFSGNQLDSEFSWNFKIENGQTGTLDTSFGANGIVTTYLGQYSGYNNAVAIQQDEKIVVVGSDNIDGVKSNFLIMRYDKYGKIDNSFGDKGIVSESFSNNNSCNDVEIQTDGKIVVVGDIASNNTGANKGMSILRFNTNGNLDKTFGFNGKETTNIGVYESASALAIQKDGKIVVAATTKLSADSDYDFSVLRYNADGSLDKTFDKDGIVSNNVGLGNYNKATSIAIQPDEKIVIAGYSTGDSSSQFALVRYNKDGSLDNTFDLDGKVTTSFERANTILNSILIQPNGKIIAAGYSYSVGSYYTTVAIAKYNIDGSLDTTFGDNGLINSFMSNLNKVNSIKLQADNKIIVGGETINYSNSDNGFILFRYNSDGSIDNSFASNGILTNYFKYDTAVQDIEIQSNGRIVVVGEKPTACSIARYWQ